MRGSKNEFPPQTGAYAVKVKSGAGWRDFDTARLQISVGQDSHEGDKLDATLDWCKHRFDHVIVCVNDTLQRFNGQFEGMSQDDAFRRAQSLGDRWITNHGPKVMTLPSAELHRWEHWRSRPDFMKAMVQTRSLFATNAEFRDAIAANIKDFWMRRKRRGGLSDDHRFSEFARLSEQYLLEETAVFSLMFKDKQAVDIYPGSVLLPCVIFAGRDVDGAPDGLGKGAFTRIDFARNKKTAPQPVQSVVA